MTVTKILTQIANIYLGIPTLEERRCDSLDFHTVSVLGLRRALDAAYASGQKNCSEPVARSPNPNQFDAYEIHPVRISRKFSGPNRKAVQPCAPEEAEFWSLFGHLPGQGLECVGDFQSREHAEEILARITGEGYPMAKG